ncbi:MAG: hypothetical protein IJ187_05145 [Neisseriaceae bacterium]|nr:hypothetical protein [Neisseriaceae bacterium]
MGDYRITGNDPNYERTKGQRNARSSGFLAKLAGWLGIILFVIGIMASSAGLILLGLGLLCVWLLLKLISKFLHNRFES